MSTKKTWIWSFLCSSLVVMASCTGGTPVPEAGPSPQSSPSPTPQASAPAPTGPSPPAVLYVRKTVVHRLDLASGADEVVVDLRSGDVFASQTSPYLAYLTAAKVTTDSRPDFLNRPELHVYDTSTGDDRLIGPGFSPLWRQGGARLAYLRPLEERGCDGEDCSGLTEVVTLDAATAATEVVSGPGRWGLLAWSGDEVLASERSDLSVTYRLPSGGGARPLPIPPSRLWDASPDGRFVLVVDGGRGELVSLEDSDRIEVDLGGGVLAEGAWAPDSARIVASLLEPRSGTQEVVTLSHAAPELRTVEGSRGTLGRVVWSSDSRSFFFVQEAAGGLRGVRCTIDLRCSRRPVAWPGRALLLAFAAR